MYLAVPFILTMMAPTFEPSVAVEDDTLFALASPEVPAKLIKG
jgi:hypothetical protein